ncbi:acid-sensing ion channel 4-A-like isoform X1 [Acipenser ruthenus]|uniref:acid-sensing ion channel 4-A-like isoform X1 n=1 Tax=Acipenser ruthenus TaxID=7906 RepID=UPI002740991F|nr:acid-sensing ion channel 4-A-like isoform X1 [Acipenser ruthenus]
MSGHLTPKIVTVPASHKMLYSSASEESLYAPKASSLKDFASSSSLHGLDHVVSDGRCTLKCFVWTAAFLGSLSFLFYHCFESMCYYLEYHHVTKLDNVQAPVLFFPAVTFCNLNHVKFSRLKKCDLYYAGFWLGLLDENDAVPTSELSQNESKHLLQLNTMTEIEKKNCNFNWTEFYDRAGYDLKEMLKSCQFQKSNCTSDDFQPVYTRYGKCYTFNANKSLSSKKAKQGGMGNGLEIMLDIQQEEYLPIWRETNETSLEAGIRVQIHSQDEPPYIHQLGFGVSPGFQTFVSCQEQRLTYLPEPWGKCRPTAEPTIPGYNYSISACRLKCEKEEVYRKCSCRMVHVPGDEKICSPHDYTECVDNALTEIIKNTEESSTCTCETPCDLTRYGKELSMVKIPSKGSARYLSKKYKHSEEYIRDNFLVLDIFFEALNYETIEQKKAYDVAGLLGDIGGQMGLFIGASILTILEILDYIFEVARDKFHRLVKPRKDPTKEQSDSVVTLGLDNMKRPDSCETQRSHPGGEYSGTILPNHHHHHSHRGVFEDFAC